MGKKKQKVRWCLVDGLKWSTQDQEESGPESLVGPAQQQHQAQQQPADRRNSQGNWRENLAPRFERRHQQCGQQRQVYYDGEYCDAEELPNGFTKIRSKNLDILFKRDYYEQKIAQREKEREQVEQSQQEQTEQLEQQEQADPPTPSMEAPAPTKPTTTSFHTIDPSEIPEFRPMNQNPEREVASGQNSPFYPGYPAYGDQVQGYGYPPVPPRPNLYLYSPSNNTLIPCEEIIIPNPVMSAEGPVYTGPTNIYLAYPVSGPDGRGYITQPFSPPPLQQDYLTYPAYSPSISVDGSTYQSSTPQTPNSGQESGSSTQPTSPPPLADYHPANWFRKEPQTPPFLRKKIGEGPRSNTEDSRQERSAEDSGSSSTPPTIQYIPGLPIDSISHYQKKAQKKKRKKKPAEPLEHRGSTSSETELPPPLQELHLTDVLADYMVNPPTEPECSDEETLSCGQEVEGTMTRDCTLTTFQISPDMEETLTQNIVTEEQEGVAEPVDVVCEEKVEPAEFVQVAASEEDSVLLEDSQLQTQPDKLVETSRGLTEMPAEVFETTFDVYVEEAAVSVDITEEGSETAAAVSCIEESISASSVNAAFPLSSLDVTSSSSVPKNKTKRRNRTKYTQSVQSTAYTLAADQEQTTSEKTEQPSHPSSPNKSYSAVCRSANDQPVPNKSEKTETKVSQPAPLPSTPDLWENVPPSLAVAPERWQCKKERKRKNKKANRVEPAEEENILEDAEPLLVETVITQLREATPESCKHEPEVEEARENQLDGETEMEDTKKNKSLKKKRRKYTSEEPEEGHRVIICDNQIEIRLCRVVRRASEVLSSQQLDLVRSSGFCDFLIVEKLGCGMARGSMNLGRLYQGKYVPPDRVDGLLPHKEEAEKEGEQREVSPSHAETTEDLELD